MSEEKTPAPTADAAATSGELSDDQSTDTKAAPQKPKVHPNRAAYELLHETYPELFDLQAAKPLKIGIHVSLAEDGKLSKTKIRRALNFYVQQLSYIRAVAQGGKRYDLNGEAGEVSAEDMAHAQARVADIEAKRKARRDERRLAQKRKGKAKADPADPASAGRSKKPKPRTTPGAKPKAAGKPERSNAEPETPANKEERLSRKLESLAQRFNND